MSDLATPARAGDLRVLRELLGGLPVADIVDELGRCDPLTRAVAFRALPKDLALEVFEDLDPALQRDLLDDLREETVRELVAGMDPDDRASLLDELPAGVAARLLSGLAPAERAMTTALLGYPPDSAGRRMSPEVAALPEGLTAGQALEHVRRTGENAETIYLLPVLGAGRRVCGVVSLRRLLVSDPATPVADLASEPIVVRATDDQELAAQVVRDYGLVAVPVVDHEERLLGVFTVDDAMRVLEREEDEDLARAGAAEPLRAPYLSVGIGRLVRTRIAWLLILVVGATLTVNVLEFYSERLETVVTLALFVPLLIGTGGNAGAQAATTVVRAMGVGDVRFADLPRVVGRELATGALLGAGLAVIGFVPAALFAGVDIATVLTLALVAVCTLATFVGSLVPMLAKRVGVDPAVVSAPFITTVVDAVGLVVYFVVAGLVLGI
ncbi:MAG TPA: magnesium transporter [Pseudonocardia sp.]|nr:magnesium transporter [Pseudonocardia sp.]